MREITISLTDETMQALEALGVKLTAVYADIADKYEAKGEAELARVFKRPLTVEDVAANAVYRALCAEGLIKD